jgi:hypothetical protein
VKELERFSSSFQNELDGLSQIESGRACLNRFQGRLDTIESQKHHFPNLHLDKKILGKREALLWIFGEWKKRISQQLRMEGKRSGSHTGQDQLSRTMTGWQN